MALFPRSTVLEKQYIPPVSTYVTGRNNGTIPSNSGSPALGRKSNVSDRWEDSCAKEAGDLLIALALCSTWLRDGSVASGTLYFLLHGTWVAGAGGS